MANRPRQSDSNLFRYGIAPREFRLADRLLRRCPLVPMPTDPRNPMLPQRRPESRLGSLLRPHGLVGSRYSMECGLYRDPYGYCGRLQERIPLCRYHARLAELDDGAFVKQGSKQYVLLKCKWISNCQPVPGEAFVHILRQ